MSVKSIEVIFKRSLFDMVRNLFVPKSKRFPRVATFSGFDDFEIESDGFLSVHFGKSCYLYPAHKIARIKTTLR